MRTLNKNQNKMPAVTSAQDPSPQPLRDYLSEVKSLSNYIISVPIVLLASYLFFNIAQGDTIITWGKEDSFFEWLTALFYFIGAILLVLTFKKNKNIFLLLLAMVLFFGAGEEIDWGQRIFGFGIPEGINKINVQHEFNIHNLEIFDGKTMKGDAKQGIARFLEMDMLFKIFTIFFGFVLPFCVYHFKFISSLTQKFKIPVPPISVGIFFLVSWICLKLSLSALPMEKDISHYWRVYMAGPEIAEFVVSYIMAIVCLYFFNNRDKNIMGMDFKQLENSAVL
jgi:uncharacterized membrane protein